MTHPNLFRVRLLAALTTGTRRLLAGTELELDAQTAAELVRAGRAMLPDPADLGPLLDALQPERRWDTEREALKAQRAA